MAQLSKSEFISKWNTLFINNSTGLITEGRMREFATDIRDSFISEGAFQTVPAMPSGVSWVELPTSYIEGSTYFFSSSKINVNGTIKDIAEGDFDLPFASDDMHRMDAIVIDYNSTVPVYVRLAGTEVESYLNALRPPIGSNYLFVQDADVKDGEIVQPLSGMVKGISVNGGEVANPNAAGIIDLLITGTGDEGGSVGGGLIADTYANIAALKTAAGLIAGTFYKITDNQTIHSIPNSNALNVHGTTYENPASWTNSKSEGIEELILLAVTPTAFAPVAYSPSFPTDLIHFNFNDVLCENGTTARRGKIVYRKDTVKNLEAYYDWRKVKFRRYKLNPAAWSAATTYGRGDSTKGSDGFIYFSKIAGNLNNNPASIGAGISPSGNHSSLIDNPIWERAFINDATFDLYFGIKSDKIHVGLGDIVTNPADFRDYYTFNTNVIGAIGLISGISIGSHTTYNNIIFRANYITSWEVNQTAYGLTVNNNTFGKGCTDMTFTGGFNSGNIFGENCSENIIQGVFYNNLIGSGFTSNLFLLCTWEYLGGTNDNNFRGDFHNNIFGNETSFNTITGTIYGNTFNFQMTCNEITTQAVNNTVQSGFRDNVCKKIQGCIIGVNAQYNIIEGGQFAGGLINATIGNDFTWNRIRFANGATIGNSVQYNNIQANQTGLNLPNSFQYNKINGIIGANTYFAAGSNRNTFNNDLGGPSGIPLNLQNCVFNKPVTGLQVVSAAVALNGITSNVSIANKTIPASLTNINIFDISPDGSLWKSGIDDMGHFSPEKIV